MKHETINLYSKYSYFLLLFSDQRNELFLRSENDLDFDKFFEAYNWVISYHVEIKTYWRNYNKTRSRLIKQFNYGKYMILLRSHHFCYDICTVILSFIL